MSTSRQTLDSRTVRTLWIQVVIALFFFWPGGQLWNHTGMILGLPSTAFWFVFALPLLNIINHTLWYRSTWAKDNAFMAEEEKRRAAS